jgi:hypothetical protein
MQTVPDSLARLVEADSHSIHVDVAELRSSRANILTEKTDVRREVETGFDLLAST